MTTKEKIIESIHERHIAFGNNLRVIENGCCVFSIDADVENNTLALKAGDAEIIAALAIVLQTAGIRFTFKNNWIKVILKAA